MITEALEQKQYCTAIFLDIEKAFDKVWHEGLLYKIKLKFPTALYQLIKSYLEDRTYYVKIQDSTSDIYKIKGGVPQGSVMGPTLYTLYTADIPTTTDTTLLTFADDTAILTTHDDPKIASKTLQKHIQTLERWLNHWKITVNTEKCNHITFTLRKGITPPIILNQYIIPQTKAVQYLGLHLDSKLTWKQHIKKKIEQIRIKRREMQWLTNRHSKLSPENKLLIYKTIIKPIWEHGIQLWGMAAKSHIAKIESLQSIVLRTIVNAPWYVRNDEIRKDLNITPVSDEITRQCRNYKTRLEQHPNSTAKELYSTDQPRRLLRRKHPMDLQL
ncbi:PREDICTED: RNA-directed DNA polymerase from mobile element jockey-like [Dufourea novaeangliae]|uniref:RNA-directed DNA polymerase from mobile element jockey-like n=1 Tax=Dufourea novaeangliae TaxID=178035 RepID=UPI000767CD3C|nr:PREDICTED: RNA-directed DNA polymerase from mobile element jockey-like [Dufourea novaeangliae]